MFFVATLMAFVCTATADPLWNESFEDYTNDFVLNGTNGWYTSADPQAVVTNAGASASVDGDNICYLPSEGVLTNLLTNVTSSVVWFDMFAKVSLREETPVLDPTATSMFYFNTSGYAVVQDGPSSNWVTLNRDMFSGTVTPVTATNWTRLTVVHNYADKKWALFVGGKLLKDNIRFINSAARMNAMVVSNQVYLDSMIATATYPTNGQIYAANTVLSGDADGDTLLDYQEIYYFDYASTQDGGDDTDGDGRSNASELGRVINPTDPSDPTDFYLDVPFRDGFESATAGAVTTNYWRGLTNFGTVVVSDSHYIEGGKSLGVHTGAVHAILDDDGTETNVWVQIYSKVQPFTDVPATNSLATNQVMGFFVLTNGNLYAYDGDHWTNTAAVPSVGTNLWLGFAVHLDYNARQYDLYVSTNNIYGAVMQRAHTNYLAFNAYATGNTNLTKIIVTNEANDYAYLDAIAVSSAYTNTGVESLTNLLAYDRLAGQFTLAQMPPYNYGAGENYLSNRVGMDLMRELEEGDKLHIYSNGWQVYEFNVGSWQVDVEGLTTPISNLQVNAAMGMQIQRVGVGVDAVAFYPFGPPVTMSSDVTVYGTNETAYTYGWNLLTSPFAEIRYPTNYGFLNPATGDRIYMNGKRISYDGAVWRQDAAVATNAMVPGTGFWYLHKGNGITWDVTP